MLARLVSLSILFLLATSIVYYLISYIYANQHNDQVVSYSGPDLDDTQYAQFMEPVSVEAVVENKSVYFLGDIMLARHVERLSRRFGFDYPYRNFSGFSGDSYVVANFEAAVPETHIPTPDFTFRFSVAQELIPDLRRFGVTHASLANNHAHDYGQSGYISTAQTLQLNNIIPFGHPYQISASSTVNINIGNQTIVLFGLMAIDKALDYEVIENLITGMSDKDLLVAYIHWGPEYQVQPSSFQRTVAGRLVDLGFDLVIGHHPHVVQAIELIDGVPILYSLGNFIFDQYFSEAVQRGLMAELKFNSGSWTLDLIGVTSLGGRSQPRLMSTEESDEFFAELVKLSEPSLTESINKRRLILR